MSRTVKLTNLSVGRGTARPFERVGAPFIDGNALSNALLEEERLSWARFVPIRFTPTSSAHAGEACGGVAIELLDPDRAEPVRLGLAIRRALRRLYPTSWDPKGPLPLAGSRRVVDALVRGASVEEMVALYDEDHRAFGERRKPYLLY